MRMCPAFLFFFFGFCSLYSPLYADEKQESLSSTSLQKDTEKASSVNSDQIDPSKPTIKAENQKEPSSPNPQVEQQKNPSKGAQTKTGESETKEGEKQKEPAEKANEAVSSYQWTYTVAFLADYRSRGISQTMRRPCVQAEFKFTHKNGIYFKIFGSNVDGTGRFLNNTSLEADIYLGFKCRLFHTTAEYDFGLLYYAYPGGRAPVIANTSYNYIEYYMGMTFKKLEIKLSISLNDYSGVNSSNPPTDWNIGRPIRPNGHSYGSPYLESNLEIPFYSKWKATFHMGYQGVNNYPELSYLDGLITLTREFEWFEATLSYVATNAKKAFYHVPDHSYVSHPNPRHLGRKRSLGGQAVIFGVDKTF